MVGLKNDVIKHSSKLKFYIIIYAGRPPCKGDGLSDECKVWGDLLRIQ